MIARLKRTRLQDFLLPIGAALVTAGLEYLADRERATRGRLAELEQAVAVRRAELKILSPDEQLPDEPAPIGSDPNMLGMYDRPGGPPADTDGEDKPAGLVRPWKLAALALGVATVVAVKRYGPAIGEQVFGYPWGPAAAAQMGLSDDALSEPYPAAEDVDPLQRATEHGHTLGHEGSDRWTGGDRRDEETAGPVDPVDEVDPAAYLAATAPDLAPLESCGWPSCDWQSDPARGETSQRTAAAVHRNRCAYRPAGMAAPGA